MAERLTVKTKYGRMDVDRDAIKFYDEAGRLCWYFTGDGLIRIPVDSPLHGNADFRKTVALGYPISFSFGGDTVSKLICVEGYKAFTGAMLWTPGNPAYESTAIQGDWLYKPDTDCWYCAGRSYPAATCKILTID